MFQPKRAPGARRAGQWNLETMLQSTLLPILLLACDASVGGAFQPPAAATRRCPRGRGILAASADAGDGKGDNKAMAFLRKVGRVGGAANMDFANAMGLDESPSGGTKSAHHEDGFKVSDCNVT